MGRKIAIIGAGADAVLALIHLVGARDGIDCVYNDDIIYWIRDCSHKVENFGVQMDPMGVNIIGANTTLSCLDFHRRFDATRKLGMKYIGFGARRDHNFFNYYDTSESSLHVDEGKLVEFFWENFTKQHKWGDVVMVDKRVSSLEISKKGCKVDGEDLDFVVDCVRGALINQDDYHPAYYNPTDTTLTVNRRIPGDWNYTAFIACEHGYLTGIPTADAQTWVYSYDSDITTEEEAVKDFNKHCEVKKHCSYKKTEWDHNISDYCIHPCGRYARTGRALGFNDEFLGFKSYPEADLSEAIAMYLYEDPDRQFTNFQRMDVEERWEDNKIDYATTLAFYCQFGTQYKSDFWEKTRADSCRFLENRDMHLPDRREVYNDGYEQEFIPVHENIRLDYFRRQAENPRHLKMRMTDKGSDEMYRTVGSNYQIFIEAIKGLGAPYADKFPVMCDPVMPPEPFGEINLDPIEM